MLQRTVQILHFVFIILVWSGIDTVSAKITMKISLFDAIRFVFIHRIGMLLFNVVWALACASFYSLHGNLKWGVSYLFAALFYLYWVIRWWWNNRGRQKFAERFGGYKYLAVLRRMGASPEGSSEHWKIKVYACRDCACTIVEGRAIKKDGWPRYPEYYRKRHDEFHRKLVS